MKRTIKITSKDLKNYDQAMEVLSDYPLYGSTCGISRGEAWAIASVLDMGLDNDTEFEITINTKSKTTIFEKYPELKKA